MAYSPFISTWASVASFTMKPWLPWVWKKVTSGTHNLDSSSMDSAFSVAWGLK